MRVLPPPGTVAPAAATLSDLVRLASERWPDAAAIAAPGRSALTYGALSAEVDEIGASLARAGLNASDRVAVCLPQGPELAVATLGVAAASACVPLNPGGRAREYELYLTETGARAVVVPAGDDGAAIQAARALGLLVLAAEVPPDAAAGTMQLRPTGGSAHVAADRKGGDAAAVALVLPTSGTTSRPKRVPLSHANLVASARSIVVALALLPHDRSLVVMPLFHIHGLMITLATLASGGTAACPGVFDPSRLAGWLAELAPTWYSAVPTIHHAVVAHAGLVSGAPELRSIRLVRSSSAPLPSRLGSELEALFGAPVIEAYGMTEAAHQITSNPLPPGERRPGSVGCPAGAEVMIVDEAGLPLPPGETGEVAIRGSGVTAGYESGADPRSRLSGGWLRTDDLGRLDRDGYLYLAGRLRELVNRGGQKIAPSEVEEVLGSHPAVAEAVVFSVPHPTLGEDVGAAVVLRPGAAAAPEALRAFARQRLADYKVPAQVRVVERVPLGPTGKLQRARMAELLGPAEGGSAAPPTTPMEAAVARVWRGLLGVEVGSGGNFFALGGDSLMAMRMLQALERACGVRLPVAAVFHAPTVEGLAAAVTLAAEGDWLVEELAALPETEALRLLAEIEGPPA